jgi:hypothetical protein
MRVRVLSAIVCVASLTVGGLCAQASQADTRWPGDLHQTLLAPVADTAIAANALRDPAQATIHAGVVVDDGKGRVGTDPVETDPVENDHVIADSPEADDVHQYSPMTDPIENDPVMVDPVETDDVGRDPIETD